VLRALGLAEERIYTAVRFGIGRYNDDAEIDVVIAALIEAVAVARARSAAASA
jgi:cysteine sulfinate desulfinase/cysteine desulfurase-like protein